MRNHSMVKANGSMSLAGIGALVLCILPFGVQMAAAQPKPACKEMRKVKLGVSVAPPNVVHTPVYVARDLGIFQATASKLRLLNLKAASRPPIGRRR